MGNEKGEKRLSEAADGSDTLDPTVDQIIQNNTVLELSN